jgi:hypothetical protein
VHEVSDGAAVRVRCGVVHLVVTSTGLRSTGGSLSQRLGSVHSWFTILLRGPEATRYSGLVRYVVDVFTNFKRFILGVLASVGMIL